MKKYKQFESKIIQTETVSFWFLLEQRGKHKTFQMFESNVQK